MEVEVEVSVHNKAMAVVNKLVGEEVEGEVVVNKLVVGVMVEVEMVVVGVEVMVEEEMEVVVVVNRLVVVEEEMEVVVNRLVVEVMEEVERVVVVEVVKEDYKLVAEANKQAAEEGQAAVVKVVVEVAKRNKFMTLKSTTMNFFRQKRLTLSRRPLHRSVGQTIPLIMKLRQRQTYRRFTGEEIIRIGKILKLRKLTNTFRNRTRKHIMCDIQLLQIHQTTKILRQRTHQLIKAHIKYS